MCNMRKWYQIVLVGFVLAWQCCRKSSSILSCVAALEQIHTYILDTYNLQHRLHAYVLFVMSVSCQSRAPPKTHGRLDVAVLLRLMVPCSSRALLYSAHHGCKAVQSTSLKLTTAHP